MLATAFALSTFAVAAWAVDRDNQHLVAAAEVGAPAVLTVGVPAGKNLGTIVDQADPGGRLAAAVDRYTSLSQRQRRADRARRGPAAVRPGRGLAPGLHQPAARRAGPRARPAGPGPGHPHRQRAAGHRGRPRAVALPASVLPADVTTGASPVILGPLPARGVTTLTAPLVGCPCVLTDLDLSPPRHFLPSPVTGSVTITAVQVRGPAGWVPATAGLLSAAARWRPGHLDNPPDRMAASAAGLDWTFTGHPHQDALLVSANRPYPLPAVVSSAMLSHGQQLASGVGLDGSPLELRVIGAASVVPGAPQAGEIVDRRYAELAAGENFPGRQPAGLARRRGPAQHRAAAEGAPGCGCCRCRTAASVAAAFARQGPALASVLFLADAAAAALLAAGAAVLGLYLSARRRRYEYAALSASGVATRHAPPGRPQPRWPWCSASASSSASAAGCSPPVLALRSVPEFLTTPAAPLSYVPAAAPVIVLLGVAVALLAVAAVAASVLLIRGVSLDQLRETPT